MGGAKGVCTLFPEPDWLVLPAPGRFPVVAEFGKGARELHRRRPGVWAAGFRRYLRRLPLGEPPYAVSRERAG